MKRIILAGPVLALLWTLQGCSSTGAAKMATETAASQARAGGAESGPDVGRYGPGGIRGSGRTGGPDATSGPLSRRVIYFEYDSDEVLAEYIPVVNAHADYLASHGGASVTLEGHADERGSSEYNIALGEQRARAVAKLMTLQGALEGQLQIVSFGEEKPAVGGHDEASWQQNRRVEITYEGR